MILERPQTLLEALAHRRRMVDQAVAFDDLDGLERSDRSDRMGREGAGVGQSATASEPLSSAA